MTSSKALLLTCEHASPKIPLAYKQWFKNAGADLKSHLGSDLGAASLAREIKNLLKVPLFEGEVSRLLIELNRTSDHPSLFSKYSKELCPKEKQLVKRLYHEPHWKKVRHKIQSFQKNQRMVVHLGIHSFTPVYHGKIRRTDVGLLYDPSREKEFKLSLAWQKELRKKTNLRIHRNLPYRGIGNGLITSLKQEFGARRYLGIEVEVNQRLLGNQKSIKKIAQQLVEAFDVHWETI